MRWLQTGLAVIGEECLNVESVRCSVQGMSISAVLYLGCDKNNWNCMNARANLSSGGFQARLGRRLDHVILSDFMDATVHFIIQHDLNL